MKKQEAQSIGEIISQLLKDQNLDVKLNETKLIKSWRFRRPLYDKTLYTQSHIICAAIICSPS